MSVLDFKDAMKNHILGSLSVIGVLGLATAVGLIVELDGAVVATGIVVVEGSIKKVQHPADPPARQGCRE